MQDNEDRRKRLKALRALASDIEPVTSQGTPHSYLWQVASCLILVIMLMLHIGSVGTNSHNHSGDRLRAGAERLNNPFLAAPAAALDQNLPQRPGAFSFYRSTSAADLPLPGLINLVLSSKQWLNKGLYWAQ